VTGSLYAKLADLEFFFWDKLAHVQKGVDLMRTGMTELEGQSLTASDALTLHMIRGITSGYVRTSFQPRSVSLQELESAIALDGFLTLDKPTVAEVYALLSKGYQELGDTQKATDYKTRALSVDPDTYVAVLKK